MFNPLTLFLFAGLLLFCGYKWAMLDDDILNFGKIRSEYTVADLLKHLGYSVSEEKDCRFITCMVYDELRNLKKNGLININSEVGIELKTKLTNSLDKNNLAQ
jgi:hypothetical protein